MNGTDNTQRYWLLGGAAVVVGIGIYLVTRTTVTPPPPQPPLPPTPGPTPGPSTSSNKAPWWLNWPWSTLYNKYAQSNTPLDPGMPQATLATVQTELTTDNDPVSLTRLADLLGSKGYTKTAAALNARAFLLAQPLGASTAMYSALQSDTLPLQQVVAVGTSPITGHRYVLGGSSGSTYAIFASMPYLKPIGTSGKDFQQVQPEFNPPASAWAGSSVIATGRTDGTKPPASAYWEVLVLSTTGVPLIAWISQLSLNA